MAKVTNILIRLVILNSRILLRLILSHRTKGLVNYVNVHYPMIKKLIDKGMKITHIVKDAKKAKQEADNFFLKAKVLLDADDKFTKIKKRYISAVDSHNKIIIGLRTATNPKTIKALKKQLPKAKQNMIRIQKQYDDADKKQKIALREFELQVIDTYLSFQDLLISSKVSIS